MSAASGQNNAKLTTEVLKKFALTTVLRHSTKLSYIKELHSDISEPKLPRKRKDPARFEVGSGAYSYPQTAEDRYRQTYFESLHLNCLSC